MNNLMTLDKLKTLTVGVLTTFLLAACGGKDKDDDEIKRFQISVTNLTHNQPMSPIAVVGHESGSLWELGSTASVALETIAEGGDNSQILELDVVEESASADAPVGPGDSNSFELELEEDIQLISVITMLVNTNDAFTGLNAENISELEVGDSVVKMTSVYDAGTEANSEMAGTIPGPADGGTGFDSARDDLDLVSLHPGVVGQDDGLNQSVLTSLEKFDNPALKIEIERLQ